MIDVRRQSNDATLSDLVLSGVTLEQVFAPTTVEYTAGVGYSVMETTVTPTLNDDGARYEIKLGSTVDADGAIELEVGENVITVEVTAEDASFTETYTVRITREPSDDATLSGLTLSGVDIGAFSSTGYDYSAWWAATWCGPL